MSSVLDLIGRVDNLNDPTPPLNKRSVILGIAVSFFVLSSLCGLGRLYTRFFITKCPGWDDGLVMAVLLSNAILSIFTILAMNEGLGQHFLLLQSWAPFIKRFYVVNGIYPQACAFIKLALLIQFLRIWDRRTAMGRAIVAMAVIVGLWGLAFTVIAWIPCWPISGFWTFTFGEDPTVRYGFGSHVVDTFVGTYVAHVSSNMIFNLIVFAIPLSLWFQPDSDKKIRWGLLGLLFLGACTNTCSIIRLISIVTTKASTYPTLDPSWYGATPIVLAVLEVNLATICASLPVFWPVLVELSMGQIFVTREVDICHEVAETGQHDGANMDDGYSGFSGPPPSFGTAISGGKDATVMHMDDLSSAGSKREVDTERGIRPAAAKKVVVKSKGALAGWEPDEIEESGPRDQVSAAVSTSGPKNWLRGVGARTPGLRAGKRDSEKLTRRTSDESLLKA